MRVPFVCYVPIDNCIFIYMLSEHFSFYQAYVWLLFTYLCREATIVYIFI